MKIPPPEFEKPYDRLLAYLGAGNSIAEVDPTHRAEARTDLQRIRSEYLAILLTLWEMHGNDKLEKILERAREQQI